MEALQRSILGWYGTHRRALPWRDSDDPYRVLVSEIMLQQTRVSRVVPAFARFLERFPDVAELAAAPRSDVLLAWQGMGYNRRAVALHRAARAVVEQHGGRIPDDLDGLRALPGVGEYTARAVLAFAFGRDTAPVDTNVRRVLSRAVVGEAAGPARLQQVADAVLPAGRGRDWNAALMDLGARFCTARPVCGECPAAVECVWAGAAGPDPAAPTRAAPERFAGSNRYHRGRLLDALRRADVAAEHVAAAADVDADRAGTIAAGLVRDGLAEWHDGRLRLPD